MKNIIMNKLTELENNHSIRILYACEAGSRAWGLHSANSDYDVRFIYVHPPSYYLSIDPVGIGKKKDVMDIPINQSIDLHGFELTKALRLFRKSNPNLLEWLHSEVIYNKAFHTIDEMLKIESTVFQEKACIHHYMNMAKRNYRIMEEKKDYEVKRYVQIIRPILICMWITRHHYFPPMQIDLLINKLTEPGSERESIIKLIDAKKGQYNYTIDYLHLFIVRELNNIEQSIGEVTTTPSISITEKLDDIFRETLICAWQ